MDLDNGKISGAQAVYLSILMLIGGVLLVVPGPAIQAAGSDVWISLVAATLLALVPGYLWVLVSARWPGKGLFDLPVAAAGRLVGGVINGLILIWMLNMAAAVTWIGSDLMVNSFLPLTPRIVVMASLALPAGLAVYQGLEVVARLNQIVFWLLVALVVGLIGLSVRDASLFHLLPVLGDGAGPPLAGMGLTGFLVHNLVLVALLPHLVRPCRPGRLLVNATVGAGALLVVVTTWTVAVFGPYLPARYQYPVLFLAHIISVADIIERLDAVIIAIWVTGMLAKVSFLMWMASLGTARVLGISDYRPLVWPLTFLMVTIANAYFRDPAELRPTVWAVAALLGLIFGVVIPPVLLGLSVVRQRGKAGGA